MKMRQATRSTYRARVLAILLATFLVGSGLQVPSVEATPQRIAEGAGLLGALLSGDECGVNSTDTSFGSAKRCIDGNLYFSRGHISEVCLGVPRVLGQIYQGRKACGKGVENIVHSRFVNELNSGSPGGGISPNIQWEVAIPGKKPDVIFYDSNAANPTLQVFEVKQRRDPRYKTVLENQMYPYVDILANAGHDAKPGAIKYRDEFSIKVPCENFAAGFAYEHYVVKDEPEGIIVSTLVEITDCGKTERRSASEEEQAGEAEIPGVKAAEEDHSPKDPIYIVPVVPPKDPPQDDFTREILDRFLDWLAENPDAWDDWLICLASPTCVLEDIFEKRFIDGLEIIYSGSGLKEFAREMDEARRRRRANGYGDPHIETFDGFKYSFQTVGEFDLLESEEYGIRVQARFEPGGDSWSGIAALAFEVGGEVVEIRNSRYSGEPALLLNGEVVSIDIGQWISLDPNSLLIRESESEFSVLWPAAEGNMILLASGLTNPAFSRFDLYARSHDFDKVRGLLGNSDGAAGNDLELRDGTVLPPSTDEAYLHGSFADSWRIDPSESLFTYESGQSTTDFTDLSFPQEVVTLADVPASERLVAEDICFDAGVEHGAGMDSCVLDVYLTESSAFANSSVGARQVVAGQGTQGMYGMGSIGTDFDGPAPTNLLPSVATTNELGTFAGPFGSSGGYQFNVTDVPSNTGGTIRFDALLFGDWLGDDGADSLAIQINRQDPISYSFATQSDVSSQSYPTAGSAPMTGITESGTLSDGTEWFRVPVEVPVPEPTDDGLAIRIAPEGLSLLSGQSVGIDNVNLEVDVVAPVKETVALPIEIDRTVNDPLEHQIFDFSLDAPRLVGVSVTCETDGTTWTLRDTTDRSVVGNGSCLGPMTHELTTGSYELTVASKSAGPYQLTMGAIPTPDVFDINVDQPVVVSGDDPGPGAGNLESVFAEDHYNFTLTETTTVGIDSQACINGLLKWSLLSDSGATFLSNTYCDDYSATLAAGTYTLVVESTANRTGNYQLELRKVAAPDVFQISVDQSVVISADNPGPGAGNIESVFAEDHYNFTVADAVEMTVETQVCMSGILKLSIIDNDGLAQHSQSYCTNQQVTLAAGAYTLVVESTINRTGNYQLELSTVPAPDLFDISVVQPVVISADDPGPGAGNLESVFAEDHYNFSLTSQHTVRVTPLMCMAGLLRWSLTDTSNGSTLLTQTYCFARDMALPPGTYVLIVESYGGRTGNYQIKAETL